MDYHFFLNLAALLLLIDIEIYRYAFCECIQQWLLLLLFILKNF